MEVFKVVENEDIEKLLDLFESGMGYQRIIAQLGFDFIDGNIEPDRRRELEQASDREDEMKCTVINAEYLFLDDKLPLTHTEVLGPAELDNIKAGNVRFRSLPQLQRPPPPAISPPRPPPSHAPPSPPPPYLTTVTAYEVFRRVSAFRNDRRIRPDRSVAPGTYLTTASDLEMAPSGLAAVGRYALPSRLPASYVFEIVTTHTTQIRYGTVAVNFGMAGGGVEVLLVNGLGPDSADYLYALPLK